MAAQGDNCLVEGGNGDHSHARGGRGDHSRARGGGEDHGHISGSGGATAAPVVEGATVMPEAAETMATSKAEEATITPVAAEGTSVTQTAKGTTAEPGAESETATAAKEGTMENMPDAERTVALWSHVPYSPSHVSHIRKKKIICQCLFPLLLFESLVPLHGGEVLVSLLVDLWPALDQVQWGEGVGPSKHEVNQNQVIKSVLFLSSVNCKQSSAARCVIGLFLNGGTKSWCDLCSFFPLFLGVSLSIFLRSDIYQCDGLTVPL